MVDSLRRRSLGLQSDPRLSRSKSDLLRHSDTPPGVSLAPPARVNPFSRREDLKGGKIKLFDTPSKSVISLTFTLPPPPDCDSDSDSEVPAVHRHRRCHSLPCTPPPNLTSAPSTILGGPDLPSDAESAGSPDVSCTSETQRLLEERLSGEWGDSGLPASLEPLSLELLSPEKAEGEEGEEEVESMDCASSPETQNSSSSPCSALPTPPSHFSTPLPPPISRGSAISNGPPCLPPLSHATASTDNNNTAVSRPLVWSAASGPDTAATTNNNGYGSVSADPAGSSPLSSDSGYSLEPPQQQQQQEEVEVEVEVVSCPGCCLAGLRFPSICLRAPPRRNPYKNLNGDHASSRGLLCPGPKSLPPSPTQAPPLPAPPAAAAGVAGGTEPGLSLPAAQA